MKELRRRAALARELWVTCRRGRREVAVFANCGGDRPLAAGQLRGLGLRAAHIGSVRVRWSEIEWIEASPCARCQNCLREHGPLQSCFIGVLAGVIVDRGEMEVIPEQLARVHVDEVWDRYGGPPSTGSNVTFAGWRPTVRCEHCRSEDLVYERDALLVATPLRLEDEVLVLDRSPQPAALDEVQIICRSCCRMQVRVRWEDWRPEQLPDGESVIDDGDAMDAIAAHVNQPGECQGADFVEFVCRLLPRTGREVLDCDV